MSTIHEIMLSGSPCACSSCEESRFIKRVKALLPEAEANELSSWYDALRDTEEARSMSLHHLQDCLEKSIELVEEIRNRQYKDGDEDTEYELSDALKKIKPERLNELLREELG